MISRFKTEVCPEGCTDDHIEVSIGRWLVTAIYFGWADGVFFYQAIYDQVHIYSLLKLAILRSCTALYQKDPLVLRS
jgi:hypothetical protein